MARGTAEKRITRVCAWQIQSKYTGQPVEVDMAASVADMLRYDMAFVHPKCPGMVFTFKVAGAWSGAVTAARWSSFGVRILEAPGAEYPPIDGPDADQYVTMAHPADREGRRDYTRLEAVTLRTWKGRQWPH
jgi:hypothetical protein